MKKLGKIACMKLLCLHMKTKCSPANPRLPMVADMEEIMADAYYGYAEVQDVVSNRLSA